MKKIPLSGPASGLRKPRIDYPCLWQYRIIGESKVAIRKAVEEYVRLQPFSLTPANVSSGGRYVSMNLELTVHGEEQRLALYRLLAGHPAVRVVL
ncbi:MAG: DUF493 domain-containing protein [Desulfobulbaceae bacterium]|jgi:putative lipoic acid-binding regulatory protein|nr:DUF493 domain-containing protein [Desulfobulbaceae bacterium]MDY0351773.1 DUF493 domain-containing protein [Desulfobulbaceae bacterium]